jgi:Secretion system C-terminal sorting domain
MQKSIISLLLLASSLYAAAQNPPDPCPVGTTYQCSIMLSYDAGGNRIARQEVCACTGPSGARPALRTAPAADATSATATTSASAPLTIEKLYPNPTAGSVRIELNAAAPDGTQLYIIDAFGRVVGEQSLSGSSAEVNLRSYPQGVYQLVVQGNTQRVIKL